MKNKILILIIALFIVIPMINANLGTYKVDSCVQIKTILNSTAVNISTISYPNSTIAITNKAMTKSGQTFNYTFCDTKTIGNYVYDYFDNYGNVYVNDFDITPTGDSRGFGLFIILLICAFFLFAIDYFVDTNYLTFLSGMLFAITGVYSMIYGIAGYAELWTRVVALISIGIGIVFMVGSAWDIIVGDGDEIM